MNIKNLFVISGFVVCAASLNAEETKALTIDPSTKRVLINSTCGPIIAIQKDREKECTFHIEALNSDGTKREFLGTVVVKK